MLRDVTTFDFDMLLVLKKFLQIGLNDVGHIAA